MGFPRFPGRRFALGPIQLLSDVQQRCEALLLQSEVQFVLSHAHVQVPGPLEEGGFPSLPVGSDRLLPVSAPDAAGAPRHRLAAGRAGLPVPLLSYSPASGLTRLLDALRGPALTAHATHTVVTAHLASVLRTAALDGRGLAWLPQSLIAPDLAEGRLVAAAPDDWPVELEVRLYRDRSAMGAAAEAFWATVAGRAAADSGP